MRASLQQHAVGRAGAAGHPWPPCQPCTSSRARGCSMELCKPWCWLLHGASGTGWLESLARAVGTGEAAWHSNPYLEVLERCLGPGALLWGQEVKVLGVSASRTHGGAAATSGAPKAGRIPA